ncbi:MAG: hypothetical protein A3K19_12360 [Lentisphaerae bacterium RIFOXYB12_FULL_65_16]|nr:MAG: hypothetical protein A3K18_01865 [Lentisphaerae bacterium RIFOXYA12_64_32]OGV86120.1 MAG: hypothetical protein A3K19_12360 [Lentisphaerae bacterium RIFOXYB12_FULL_65_16]
MTNMATEDRAGRDVVRELAKRVAELARSEENARRLKRWCDFNTRRELDRPPVICHPGSGVWEELLPRAASVVAKDPWLAGVEYAFRQQLFKWHDVGDDTVIVPWYGVGRIMRLEGDHLWGVPVQHVHAKVDTGGVSTRAAWRYEPPLREESDLERIKPPKYRYDVEATRAGVARTQELLGDIFEIREVCAVPGPGAWLHGWATELRGVEQLLFDLMDRPEWVHRLMRTLMEGFLGVMDQFEQARVLTPNNHGIMACDDLPQKDFDPKRVRIKDLWGRGESQEFQAVGPVQYEEFLLRYQIPILQRFGITYYGCCEDLTNKIDLVLSIPNLRRFVCSAWTNLGKVAEAVGRKTTLEWRQKASDVVFPKDLSGVKLHLDSGLRSARGCNVMIVLQELETVAGHQRRLADWAAMAKDVGARCAG